MLAAAFTLAAATTPSLRFEPAANGQYVARTWSGPAVSVTPHGVTISPGGFRIEFAGASASAKLEPLDPAPSRSNYLLGNNPRRWRTGVSQFRRLRCAGIYPGIDLVYYENDKHELEWDFIVQPGADPELIEFSIPGVRLDARGDLRWRGLRLRRPVSYQQAGRGVPSRYVRRPNQRIGIALGNYDRSRVLIVDPVLDYSTYFGGTGGSSGESVAVDAAGFIYLAGSTNSNTLPTSNPMQPYFYGSTEVFVAKFDPSGAELIYSTYIGSSGDDRGISIAVDAEGCAYLTGFTTSTDFPLVNPLQSAFAGGSMANGGDAFVLKLSAAGDRLVYSTYLGGVADEFARSIKVDANRSAYVVGSTASIDFPVKNPIHADYGGGTRDVFLAKLSPEGSDLMYATYLGGSLVDEGYAVALDSEGNAYVTGTTTSLNFPVHAPFQLNHRGGARDSFVTKINAAGDAIIYSTYLGGTADDFARAIAVDAEGGVYVAGYTTSGNFPVARPLQRTYATNRDAFVTQFNPAGSQLVYSTFLGGRSLDDAYGIALDSANRASVIGLTQSPNFPSVNAIQGVIGSPCPNIPCTADLFTARIAADGSELIYSSYLGGLQAEAPRAIAVDSQDHVWLTGNTLSANFPVKGAIQARNAGGGAAVAFLVRITD
ncbi:MAG: SBBP repeat-containing protein [Bryobacteraceae bacterium]